MIPCLYQAKETEFDSNGIGKLADCTSCVVTEKRNGEYELSMTYPAEGIHAEDIVEENLILTKPSDTAEPQPFRIYQITKSMDGSLEVAAQHISYQLNYITVSPCSAVTGTYDQVNAAFEALKKNATSDCPFTFETDIESESYFGILEPVSLRSALGGVSGSVLDSFGGEYEWDRYTVRLWKSRGSDNGVRIVYGKNLVDFSQEKSTEDTITGVHPYWIDSETGVVKEITGKVVTIADSGYAYEKIGLLDCSEEFETEPTEADLVSFAESYLASSTTTEPNIDISVNFAQLWGLPEYAEVAEAEHVSLCDTVHVYVPNLGIDLSMSVTETEYDALLERYNSITLSTSKTSSRNSAIELTLATTSNVKSMIAMTDSSIRLSVYNRYVTKENLEDNYSTTVEVQSMISLTEEAITLDYTKKMDAAVAEINDDLATNYSKTTEIQSMIELSEEGITLDYTKAVNEAKETIETNLAENYSTTTEIQSMIDLSEEGITLNYTKAINETSQTLQQTISDTADDLQSNIDDVANNLETNYSKTTEVQSMIDLSEDGITLDYTKAITETSETLQKTISDTADDLQSSIDGVATDLATNYSTTTEIESMIALSEEGITLDYTKAITETSETIQKTISDTADGLQSNIDGVATELSTNYSTTTEVEALISTSEQGITLDYTKMVNETSETLQQVISNTSDDLQQAISDTADSLESSIAGLASNLETNYSKTTEIESMISASESGITLDYTQLVRETSETIQKTISDTTDDLQASIDGVSTELRTKYSTTTEVESMISASESGITLDYTKLVRETSETIQQTISDTADGLQSSIDDVADDLSSNYSSTTEIKALISASEKGITLEYQSYLTENYSTTSQVESLISAGLNGITLSVSGSLLSGTASITMTAGNNAESGTIDLSGVRQAFADDTTAITISAGTITFDSNTLIVNSNQFQLDKNGNATFSGALSAATGSFSGTLSACDINSNYIRIASDNSASATSEITNCLWIGGPTMFTPIYGGTTRPEGVGTIYQAIRIGITTSGGDAAEYARMSFSENGNCIIEATNGVYVVDHITTSGTQYSYMHLGDLYLHGSLYGRLTLENSYVDVKTAGIALANNYGVYHYKADGSGFEKFEYLNGSNQFCIGQSSTYPTIIYGNGVYLNGTSTSITSDARLKTDITELTVKQDTFFDNLTPRNFRLKDRPEKIHTGFVVQEVEQAMEDAGLSPEDFGLTAWLETDGTEYGSIIYDEIIALLVHEVQGLKNKVKELEATV